jgi:GcrA cell cycle regulator
VWTTERIALLLKLDAENVLSRAQIANELAARTGSCFTRNAVIGKLMRLGVPKKERPDRKPPYMPRPRYLPGRSSAGPRPAPAPRPVSELIQDSLRLSLFDLTETTCRYPTNDEPWEFCGHPICAGSYCALHAQICYNPREPHVPRLSRQQHIRAWKLKCQAA